MIHVQIKTALLGLLLLGTVLSACSEKTNTGITTEKKPVEIITVNNPLYYFTRRLAGDLATVSLPAPKEGDPSQWIPGLEKLLAIQQADLIILNGAGYSSWLDKISLSSKQTLNSSLAAKAQWIPLTRQATHSHGPTGEHSHSGYAITTWMDISIAKQQASAIAEALIQCWPDQQAPIKKRQVELLAALAELDEGYRQQAKLLAGKQLFYSHPVYQYFERHYQLAGHSLHWEPTEMPSDSQWLSLQQKVAENPNTLFIWEDTPAPLIAERMAAMGVESIVISPAANIGDKDWLTTQQQNLQRLKALSGG
jgi:zinc transport system substrate-binding protein